MRAARRRHHQRQHATIWAIHSTVNLCAHFIQNSFSNEWLSVQCVPTNETIEEEEKTKRQLGLHSRYAREHVGTHCKSISNRPNSSLCIVCLHFQWKYICLLFQLTARLLIYPICFTVFQMTPKLFPFPQTGKVSALYQTLDWQIVWHYFGPSLSSIVSVYTPSKLFVLLFKPQMVIRQNNKLFNHQILH